MFIGYIEEWNHGVCGLEIKYLLFHFLCLIAYKMNRFLVQFIWFVLAMNFIFEHSSVDVFGAPILLSLVMSNERVEIVQNVAVIATWQQKRRVTLTHVISCTQSEIVLSSSIVDSIPSSWVVTWFKPFFRIRIVQNYIFRCG